MLKQEKSTRWLNDQRWVLALIPAGLLAQDPITLFIPRTFQNRDIRSSALALSCLGSLMIIFFWLIRADKYSPKGLVPTKWFWLKKIILFLSIYISFLMRLLWFERLVPPSQLFGWLSQLSSAAELFVDDKRTTANFLFVEAFWLWIFLMIPMAIWGMWMLVRLLKLSSELRLGVRDQDRSSRLAFAFLWKEMHVVKVCFVILWAERWFRAWEEPVWDFSLAATLLSGFVVSVQLWGYLPVRLTQDQLQMMRAESDFSFRCVLLLVFIIILLFCCCFF
jgi:hypothetical protein